MYCNIFCKYCAVCPSMYQIMYIMLHHPAKLLKPNAHCTPTPNVVLVYILQNNNCPFVIPHFIIIPQTCTIPSVIHFYHHNHIIVIQTFLTVLRNVFSPNPCHMFYLSTKCYISQCDYHHTHDIPILIFMITHLIVLSYAPSFMTDRYIR